MKKVVLTCLVASILLASTAGAVKTYGNYKKNEFSELLLEDVEAKAWIQVAFEVVVGLATIGGFIYQISQGDSDDVKWEQKSINEQLGTKEVDGNTLTITYHAVVCEHGGNLTTCRSMNIHEKGDLCNSHQ